MQKNVLKGNRISKGWWHHFLARNSALSLCSGDATAGVRLDTVNQKNIQNYFALLKEVYNGLSFRDHPECIYNVDETGVPLDPYPPKIVAKKCQCKVRYHCSGQKTQITVIGCANAVGHTMPPFTYSQRNS